MIKKLFLPVGMIVAVLAACFIPEWGTALKKMGLSSYLIVAIFLICGLQTDTKNVKFERKLLLIMILGGILSLVISPLLALLLTKLLSIEALPAVGLIVIAAVPPTLSSGIVMTENADGNVFLAMTLTIVYSLAGVLTLPIMLSWCLEHNGDINTNPLRMFTDLVLLVVLPFIVGCVMRKLGKKELPSWCGYVPSLCVILLVLAFFSSSHDLVKSYPVSAMLLAAAGSLILHLGLMTILWFGGKFFHFGSADCKALIFTGGSKTITLALATLAILGAADGAAVVPCLVFYFLQMMIDSSLAGKMGLARHRKHVN